MRKLNYQEFVEQLKGNLLLRVSQEIQLEVYPVLKNNSLHLDSLVLYREDRPVSPNFYLQDYYDKYLTGQSLDRLAEEILDYWEKVGELSAGKAPSMLFEDCCHKIVYRLVNGEKNQELLERIPYVPFMDLAIIFYVLVSRDDQGISSVRISNDMMERWQIDTRTLLQWAEKNTKGFFPERCSPLSSLLEHLLFHNGEHVPDFQAPATSEPYILTNSNGINGASAWLYPDVPEKLADYFGINYYILPSSIHELLILPDAQQFTREELLGMVAQVNRDCVLPEEVLSENIYYYDIEKKKVRVYEG